MTGRRGKFLILMVAVSASVQAKSENIGALEQSARLNSQQKKWDQVIAQLNPNTDVASPSGYLLLASAYHEKRDFTNLVRVLRLLAEKRPKDHHVQYMLGDAELKRAGTLGEIEDRQSAENLGIESIRTAIKLKKDFRPAHQALINFFLRSGQNHEAREQLGDMLKIYGQKGDVNADLCRLFSIDGFLSQAVKHCMRAMQLAPKFPESYVYLAQAFYDQKEMARSEETLVDAAKRFPESEFVQYGAGQFFLKKNNYPVATKYLKRAVANKADSIRSLLSLAQSLFESGAEADALPQFVKACQLSSSAQSEILGAAARLRLKGNGTLAGRYSQAAGGCKRP